MTHLEGFADEFVMVGQVGPAVDAGVGPVAGGQILAECLRHLRAKNKFPLLYYNADCTFLCSSYAPPGSELLAGPVLPMLVWSAAEPPGDRGQISDLGISGSSQYLSDMQEMFAIVLFIALMGSCAANGKCRFYPSTKSKTQLCIVFKILFYNVSEKFY